jgi:hypothetical protein
MSRSRDGLRLIREAPAGGATDDEDTPMKFMLLINAPSHLHDEYWQWPKKDLQAHMDFMRKFVKKLSAAGELVSTEGLASPAQAKLVRAGEDGRPVTDGPFAETKEFLAGYWIIDVDSAERAYEIAAEASTAPGLNGVPSRMPIEVREVMNGAPPLD